MTLYRGGTIFAIVAMDESRFKSDALSDAAWDEAGCARFSYARGDGTSGSMNYRRAPAQMYDDADAVRTWAARGIAAGRRKPVKQRNGWLPVLPAPGPDPGSTDKHEPTPRLLPCDGLRNKAGVTKMFGVRPTLPARTPA